MKGRSIWPATVVRDRRCAIPTENTTNALAHRSIGHVDKRQDFPGREQVYVGYRIVLGNTLHDERSGRTRIRRISEDLGEHTRTNQHSWLGPLDPPSLAKPICPLAKGREWSFTTTYRWTRFKCFGGGEKRNIDRFDSALVQLGQRLGDLRHAVKGGDDRSTCEPNQNHPSLS
jgi:hypothetical protein